MPRRRKPHRHEIVTLPADADVPFERTRAIYTRLSDDDPDSVSHAHQEDAARRYAEDHGYTVTAIYRDWRTGFDADRLGFQALIRDAHARRHAGVIVYDHYRFHRGVTGAYPVVLLSKQLPAYKFEATVGGYDVAQIGIWAGISGMEAETTRRRSTEQRRRRAAEGQWMAGMRPYWLDRDPKTRAAVINWHRAEPFLQAMSMYAQGTPMTAVCRYLTENAPARTHGAAATHWTAQRLRKAFRNPALWGELPYGRFTYESEQRGSEIVITQRLDNPDAIPFTVPPLIHKTELERTECRVRGGCGRDAYPTGQGLDDAVKGRRNHEGGRTATVEHPLRRRVVCACGWRMWFQVLTRHSGRGGRTYEYLGCAQQNGAIGRLVLPDANRPRCPLVKRKLPAAPLWSRVQQLVIDAIRDPERLIAEVQASIVAEAAAESRTLAEEARTLEQLTDELARLDDDEHRLYMDWRNEDVSRAVYDRERARVASRRRELEQRKRQLLAQRVVVQQAARATEQLREGLQKAALLPLDRLTLQEWSELLGSLVQDVVLDEQGNPSFRWRQGV